MERVVYPNRKQQKNGYFSGFVRLFDPAGLMNKNYRLTNVFEKIESYDCDKMAIFEDWETVGHEISNAIEKQKVIINGKETETV